jgi:hypothetical protein
MTPHLRRARIFWGIAAGSSLVAAGGGIADRTIYAGLFPPDFLPGAFPQDLLTVGVALALFVIIGTVRESELKKQVVIAGLVGSLFYLYGIFTIERVYNSFYLVYAAAFASSFWSLIYGLSGFARPDLPRVMIPGAVLKTTAVSSIVIAILFTILWTLALLPLMHDHQRIEYLYSIYILDLCFIMPAFFITGVMALRGKPFGILMGPAVMILGFFVIFPLGLNELAKSSAGMPVNAGAMLMSFGFAAYMLAVGAYQLARIRPAQAGSNEQRTG